MARIEAKNIFLENGTDEAELAIQFENVIENFEKLPVSLLLKADPITVSAGSAEYKRFENAVSKAYGTARTAGKGVALETKPIQVPIDVHREIIEEFRKSDVAMYGVAGLMAKRYMNHPRTMARDLDTAFFAQAYKEGTKFAPTNGVAIDVAVEELIVKIEKVSNAFIDGIDRELIGVVLTPDKASALRTKIDTLLIEGNRIENGLLGQFHGVDIFVSNRLPKGVGQVVDMMGMVKGAVAQPVLLADQYAMEKIPLSNDWAVELFFDYGTKALLEDTIFYVGDQYSSGE